MSDPALHVRASALFVELRALPPSARAAALRRAAAGDARLATEVESLLAHDVEDGESAADPAPPQRIGPYRILSRLGRGSSGEVFLGEQEQPIRRRVAIKVVPLAAISPEWAARLEVERAALEATDHPHIARVLDAGRTAEGLPYLVMNFVDGETITAHCARRRLALADRVRLMLQVADAVHHAHQRGVIHRDLKPANVLVAEVDGRASPQVVDFGIAKPLAGAFPVESPPTLGLPLGTPAYMAPEQTRVGPIDIRADVYALGAILYELVAGRPPLEVDGDPLVALARLRESVPRPASQVRARGPAADAGGPATRAVLADLDVILGKALEKQPERRYASVDAFGQDLQRLLACEPIAARAPSWGYRTARFARRNRLAVAAGGVALVALGGGVVMLWTGLREAERQREQAEARFTEKEEVNRFLTDDVLALASPELGGPDLSARELLDRASARIERRLAGQPLVAAAIHHALGEAYAQLADFDVAQRHFDQALELRTLAAGPDSADTVHTEIARASLLARQERYTEAQAALVPALARARLILDPGDPALDSALNDLGVVMIALERPDEALDLLREALEGRRRLLPPDDPKIVDTLSNTAQALDAQGRTEEALALLIETAALADASPDTPRMTRLGLHNNIGATLQDLDRDAEAEPHLRTAVEMAHALFGPEHPWTLTIESNLASLESDLGRPDEALAAFQRVVDGQTALLGPDAVDTLTARHGYWSAMRKAGRPDEAAAGFSQLLDDVTAALGAEHSLTAQTEISLAHALADAGRVDEALPHARAAEQRLTALYGAENPRATGARQLVESLLAGR
jgi:tetratricopeptide (TPR) repeat protein